MNNYGNFENLKTTIIERIDKGSEDAAAGRPGRLVLIAFDHECLVVLDKEYSDITIRDREALDDWFAPRGTTALFDGVLKSVEWVQRYEAPNKVVVLITDGLENASLLHNAQQRAQDAIAAAQKNKVSVFLVGDQDCLKKQETELKMLDPRMVIPLSREGSMTLQRVVTSCTRGKMELFTVQDQINALR